MSVTQERVGERCPSLELAEESRRIGAFVIWGLERVDVVLG